MRFSLYTEMQLHEGKTPEQLYGEVLEQIQKGLIVLVRHARVVQHQRAVRYESLGRLDTLGLHR